MKNTAELLHFHRDATIPPVNSGEDLVKFHGRPAVVPSRSKGELREFGPFTRRQMDTLLAYEQQRVDAVLEGGEVTVFVPDNRLEQTVAPSAPKISYD